MNEEAFSGKVSASIDSANLTEETDLARFIRALSLSKLTGLRADEASEAFINALAVAVVKSVAAGYGLHADNIYGLNYAKLNETKTAFGMSDTAFQKYLKGIAEKIYESTSNKDQFANIYVLFADRFASGANMAQLVAALSQGKGRVIIVANHPSDYHVNVSYQSLGLDLVSALEVASSVLYSLNPKLHAPGLAESLVKLMYGFRKVPEQVNLVSVENSVKDALARLGTTNDPSETEVVSAVTYALGASKEGYDSNLFAKSSILLDNLKVVEENVRKDQAYYFNEAKGLGKGTREDDMRRAAQERKNDEALRADKARRDYKKLMRRIKLTREKLDEAAEDIKATINPALMIYRRHHIELIRRRRINHLMKLYGSITAKLYDLSINKREAFEAENNSFTAFFSKIQSIVADTSYFGEFEKSHYSSAGFAQ